MFFIVLLIFFFFLLLWIWPLMESWSSTLTYPYRDPPTPRCFIHNRIDRITRDLVYDPRRELTNEDFTRLYLEPFKGTPFRGFSDLVTRLGHGFMIIDTCGTDLVSLMRRNKEYGFQIRIFVQEGFLQDLSVVGNPGEGEAKVILPATRDVSALGVSPNDAVDAYLTPIENNGTRILLTDKQQKDVYINLLYQKKKFVEDRANSCYNNDRYVRQDFCEGETGYLGEKKTPSVWDRPCFKNSDCPFFRANTNYPNERGGCQNGFCEMPINIDQVSYQRFSRKEKPYCYNCVPADETYTCCEEQQQSRFRRPEYQLMTSPDYAFINDLQERFRHQEALAERGLEVLPTK